MSDLYLRLVNTPVGRTAAQSLGLPAPAPLKRLKRTDQPFIEGKVLIGAANVHSFSMSVPGTAASSGFRGAFARIERACGPGIAACAPWSRLSGAG